MTDEGSRMQGARWNEEWKWYNILPGHRLDIKNLKVVQIAKEKKKEKKRVRQEEI